jgi:hypothetical protein
VFLPPLLISTLQYRLFSCLRSCASTVVLWPSEWILTTLTRIVNVNFFYYTIIFWAEISCPWLCLWTQFAVGLACLGFARCVFRFGIHNERLDVVLFHLSMWRTGPTRGCGIPEDGARLFPRHLLFNLVDFVVNCSNLSPLTWLS